MASSNNTTSTLNGFFKTVFGPSWLNAISPAGKLLTLFPFDKKNLIGKAYSVPVVVNLEQGFTASAPDQDAFDLLGSIASSTREASVNAYQLVLQAAFSYEVAAKATKSETSFLNVMELRMQTMIESFERRLVIETLYGQSGLGVTASSANVDVTHTAVTFSAASWAPSFWVGAENATMQFYTAVPGLISSGADSIFTVQKVNFDTRVVTFTGTTTGITALDAATAAGASAYFNGFYGNEMAGQAKIITNTGSLFGIDASTYGIWKGNSYAVGGAITMQKLLRALGAPTGRGLEEDATLLLGTQSWADLNADLHGNRRYDGSYRRTQAEAGMEAIEYVGQNGVIKIIGSGFIKGGDGMLFPNKKVKRVGSVERSFSVPGEDEVYFRHIDAKAGYEYRIYGAQSVFNEAPSQSLMLTGIVAAT